MINFFQSDMMFALVFLVVTQCIAFGMTWVKHTTDYFDWYDAEQIITNAALTIVGTMLSILIAFAIVVVWGNFNKTNQFISDEINALSDIERASEAFPFQISRAIHRATENYVHTVLQDEWTNQNHTKVPSERAQAVFLSIGDIVNNISAADKREHAESYKALLAGVYDLSHNRRARIMSSKSSIPSTMWVLILTISVSAIFLVANSESRLVNRSAHCIISLVTSGSIALSIILIYSLDNPYTGLVSIDRAPFSNVIQQ